MIAMKLGTLEAARNVTYWAPISGPNEFPQAYSKDLFRLDDGVGSGDVLIETSALLYHGVKLTAHPAATSSWMEDYSYQWPSGVNRVVYGTISPIDFINSNTSLPQVPLRTGFIVFPIDIPANHWYNGGPYVDGHFTCYAKVTTNRWSYNEGYQPRAYFTLIGDVPDYGKYHWLWVKLNPNDVKFSRDVPLDVVWDTVTSVEFLTQWALRATSYNMKHEGFDPTVPNGKAVRRCDSYLLDFSKASASLVSPNKGEYSFWFGRATGVINNPSGIDPKLFSRAFYDAQDKLPEAQQNQIANICDIVGAIRDFKKRPYLTIERGSDAAKNAWLAYRYSYSTTKSDILELSSLANRLQSIGSVVKSYGSHSTSSAKYYAEIVVDASYYMPQGCSSLLRKLSQYGVKLNAQNVWDMIPYSFVLDWFLDVSSLLHSFDQWIAASSIPIKEVWYSCVTSYSDGRAAYFRWRGEPPSLPSWSYSISKNGGTWLKRIADAISLF